MNRIICGSSESMSEVSDGSVALTVTSPPYWNAIDYDRHSENGRQNYRTRRYSQGFSGYDDYLALMTRVFSEVLRVTRPGGFCGIVIGTVLLDRKLIPVPFDLTPRLIDVGWEFHQDIVWHKCTAGVKRAGVAIQKPFPGYFYPNIMTEYILLFRKPGDRISASRSQKEIETGRFPINALFTKDIANNIWHIAPVPPRQIDHPCPFPEEIPYRLISLYSYPGDLVLDPFLGSGQTAKVSLALDRNAVGYEIEKRYAEYARRRSKEPLSIRPKQLVAVFEKVNIDAPLSGSSRKGITGKTRHGSGRYRAGEASSSLFGKRDGI